MRRRENREHLTWCQAFYEAYMSRGHRTRNGTRDTNRMEKWNARAAVVSRKLTQILQNIPKRMKASTGPTTTNTFSQESEVNKSSDIRRRSSTASSPPQHFFIITSHHDDDNVENGLLFKTR